MTVFECFEEIQLDLFRAQNYDFTDLQIKRLDFIKQHLCDGEEAEKAVRENEKIEALKTACLSPNGYMCAGLCCDECDLESQGGLEECTMLMALRILNMNGYDIVKIK